MHNHIPDELARRIAKLEELLMFAEHRAEQAEAVAKELSEQVARLHARTDAVERRIDAIATPDAPSGEDVDDHG